MPNQHTPSTYQEPKIRNWPVLILGIMGVVIVLGIVLVLIVNKGSVETNLPQGDNSERGSILLSPNHNLGNLGGVPLGNEGINKKTPTNNGSESSNNNQTNNNQTNNNTGNNESNPGGLDTRNEARCANITTITNVWDCGYCKGQFVSGGPYGGGVCQARANADLIKFACEGESSLGKPCATGIGLTSSPVGYQCGSLVGQPNYCCREGYGWNGSTCIPFSCYNMSTLTTASLCSQCGQTKWTGTACAKIDCSNKSQLRSTFETCQSCGFGWVSAGGGVGACHIPSCGEPGTHYGDCSVLLPPKNSSFGVCKFVPASTTAFHFEGSNLVPNGAYSPCVEKCQVEPRAPSIGETYLNESVKSVCCPGTELVNGQCRSVCTYGARLSDGCPPAPGTQRWTPKQLQASGASGPGICGTQSCTDQYVKNLYAAGGDSMFWKAVADGVIPDTEAGLGTLLAYSSMGSVYANGSSTGRPSEVSAWFSTRSNIAIQNIYTQMGLPPVHITSMPLSIPITKVTPGVSMNISGVRTDVPAICLLSRTLNDQPPGSGIQEQLITTNNIDHTISLPAYLTKVLYTYWLYTNRTTTETERTINANILCYPLGGDAYTFLIDKKPFTFIISDIIQCNAQSHGLWCNQGTNSAIGYNCVQKSLQAPNYVDRPYGCCRTNESWNGGWCL